MSAGIVVYGAPQSTYVRTACMVCEEKGAAYRREDIAFGSPELHAMHPFGKIPALRHGDISLFETVAITRYLDRVCSGRALQPADAGAAAVMDQWISVTCSYVYAPVIRGLVLPRFGLVPQNETAMTEARIAAEHALAVIDDGLAGHNWLAGDDVSLADLFLAPILGWLWTVPEGQELQPAYAHIGRWFDAVSGRVSFRATMPPMPS